MSQYIAMNRFKIVKGHEADFEEIWKTRNTYLDGSPGFIEFNLLRGPEREDHVLYASHTLWDSESAFEDELRSLSTSPCGSRQTRSPLFGPSRFRRF
jgi:heme-degrading monooxygenase HmoA